MGFGISVGPRLFRVRVSTRGVGVSSGVGPFSVFAHSSGRRRRRSTIGNVLRTASYGADGCPVHLPGETTTTHLLGESAHQLVPTGFDELVTQLNRAQRWIVWWVWVTLVCVLLSFVSTLFLVPMVVALAVALVGLARRRVVLHYEVDSDLTEWFKELVAGWPSLARTSGKWRVQTRTHLHQTRDRKTNAGAGNLVSRHTASCPMKLPVVLNANVEVPTVRAKRHSLLFLPDRLLVKSGTRWSDVDYQDLTVSVSHRQFIENGSVPSDGAQIGETWQYANVRGGPDRRFKNNRRLPVMLYSEVVFSSSNGLSWSLNLSRHEVAAWWQQIIRARPQTPLLTSTSLSDAPTTSGPTEQRTPTPPVVVELGSGRAAAPRRTSKAVTGHVPPNPAGWPRAPWGLPLNRIEVAGGFYHEQAIAAIFAGVAGYKESAGAELKESAVMVPDPDNPHGQGHAVAVFVRGHHVGYVPHFESNRYFPQVTTMTARGLAVTVDARVWASENAYGNGFCGRVTLLLPELEEIDDPRSMPADKNAVLLPPGNALQVTGEGEHLDFLMPYIGESVAVTLHNITVQKSGKRQDLVEIRLDGETVGRFIPSTSAKVGPLVNCVEQAGGLPVARARVAGSSLKADVTVYVARAGDVPQDWFDGPGPAI